MVDLADVSTGDVITSARQNLINDYIQDGTHKIDTLSIDVGGTEVITSARAITNATNTNWDAASTHVTSNGTDHTYINQNVTTTGTPTFTGITTASITMGAQCGYIYLADSAGTIVFRHGVTGAGKYSQFSCNGDFCVKSGSIFTCGSTCVSSPTICGSTIVRSPTVYGSTLVCGATVCATTGLTAVTTTFGTTSIELNSGGSGNRYAYIDFHGDDTYTDYGLRIMRSNAGSNAPSQWWHRGTGAINIIACEAAVIDFKTTNTVRLCIAATGAVCSCVCHSSPILCGTTCVRGACVCATAGVDSATTIIATGYIGFCGGKMIYNSTNAEIYFCTG